MLTANQAFKQSGGKGKAAFKEWLSVHNEYNNTKEEAPVEDESKLSANGYSYVTAETNLPVAAKVSILGMSPTVFAAVAIGVTVAVYLGVKYYKSSQSSN